MAGQRFYGAQLTDAHLRMALVPEGEVELLEEEDGSESPFPLVLIDRSLYVLPGVPHLCRHQFPLMQRQLKRGTPMPKPKPKAQAQAVPLTASSAARSCARP